MQDSLGVEVREIFCLMHHGHTVLIENIKLSVVKLYEKGSFNKRTVSWALALQYRSSNVENGCRCHTINQRNLI